MSNATAVNASLCPGAVISSTMDPLRCVTQVPPGARPHVVVPENQVYYWSHEWQNAEGAALDELRRGLGVEFDSVVEAVRWLLTDDG